MTLYSGQAEISGISGGSSAQLSVILVLFILLCVVMGTFFPSFLVSEEGSATGRDPVPFNIVNQTDYVFYMYNISGGIAQYPTSFNLRPNGGSTTVYVTNPGPVGYKKVVSNFIVHPTRRGADFERDGLVNVAMEVRESTVFLPYRRFESVEIARAPENNPIRYQFYGLTLTFANQ